VEDDPTMLNVVPLKRNATSFENCEKKLVELKAFLFKTLY
jgi:hypothetical protein